jgi:hypothetical protein
LFSSSTTSVFHVMTKKITKRQQEHHNSDLVSPAAWQ